MGHCCGTCSVPGPGTSICLRSGQNKRRKLQYFKHDFYFSVYKPFVVIVATNITDETLNFEVGRNVGWWYIDYISSLNVEILTYWS